ncbi:MAG: hypothetical protein ABIK85_00565, partial [Candidatus Eisenbacteria bacterium]
MRNLVVGLLIAVVMCSSSGLAAATAPPAEGYLANGAPGSFLKHVGSCCEWPTIKSARSVHAAGSGRIGLVPSARILWLGLRPFQAWGMGYECEFEPAAKDSTWTRIKWRYRKEKP